MEIGLRLPNNGPNASAAHIIEIGRLAEELGFDSLWSNDHIIMPASAPLSASYGRLYEAFITLAVLSGVTHRVKLGTGVLILPLREPLLVAKQAAAIDAYSNGRLILGVGVGWEENEFRFLNAEFNQRGRRCDEWLGIMRTTWQGSPINISSETHRIIEGLSEPTPVQTGGPPILIGGYSKAALRRAALLGDGWLPGSEISVETISRGMGKIKTLAPPDHKGIVCVFRRPAGSFAQWQNVEQMLTSLHRLKAMGVAMCVLVIPEEFSAKMMTKEIELFAEKVMPHVH